MASKTKNQLSKKLNKLIDHFESQWLILKDRYEDEHAQFIDNLYDLEMEMQELEKDVKEK